MKRGVILPGYRPQYGGNVLFNDIEAWLPINEKAGSNLNNIVDALNDAAMSGGSWVGNGVRLDGTDDIITMRRIVGLTDWTVAIRYIPSGVSGIQPLLDMGEILIYQSDDDIIYGATDDTYTDYTSTLSAALTADKSIDLVVSRSGTTITIQGFSDRARFTDSFTVSGTALTALANLIIGSNSRTTFASPALPTLTTENGISINAADVLKYGKGSDTLNSDKTTENWNKSQFTIRMRVSLNFVPGDGLKHQLMDNQGTGAAQNRVQLYIDTAGLLTFVVHDKDSTQHLVAYDVSGWTAGTEYQIVATLDFNADAMVLYTDGSVRDNTPTAALSSDSIDAIEANTHVGMDTSDANQINGTITFQLFNRPWTSAEVGADDPGIAFVVDSDTILMGNYAVDTGALYWHKGQKVDSTTASQVTLAEAVGARSWNDNDLVVVSDATGFKVEGKINEPGGILTTDTTLELDNLSPNSLAEVGMSLDFDDQYSTSGGNILDIAGDDFEIDFWMAQDGDPVGSEYIIAKNNIGSAQSYTVYLSAGGNLVMRADDGTNDGNYSFDITSLLDNRWHHYYLFTDRSDISSCTIYVDGIVVTPSTSGVFPTLTLANAYDFKIGNRRTDDTFSSIRIRDARIHIGGTMATDAQILYRATHPFANGVESWTLDGTREHWKLTEGSGTTNSAEIDSPANDLTLTDAAAWSQEAYLSRDLLADVENGGIGHIADASIDSTITVTKDTSIVHSDTQSEKIVFTAANDNVELLMNAPTLVSGADYWRRLWVFPTAIHDDSKLYLDIDGSATPILSREIGKSLDDRGNFARSFDLDDTYTATAVDNTKHQITNEDVGCWAWVKVNTDANNNGDIFAKRSGAGYIFQVKSNGTLRWFIQDGDSDTYVLDGNTDIRDNKWHFVAAIIDKSNTANCKVYLDGVEDGSTQKTGTLGDIGSITNAAIFGMGIRSAANKLDGEIAEVGIAYPADIMAAGEMGAAGEIANLYNNPGDPSQWPNSEDYWLCNDNTGSTVVIGANNNLVASANTDVFAVTNWKMYEMTFQADQVAITESLRTTGAGAGANTATVYLDDAELRENLVDNPGAEGGANPPAGWTQEGSATVVSDTSPHSGTNCLKNTAGAANVGASQNVTLVSGKYYTVTGWAKATSGDTAEITMDTGDGSTFSVGTVTATIWTQVQATFLATGTSGVIYLRGVVNGDIVWFDDVSLIQVDEVAASTATRTRDFAAGDIEEVAIWSRALDMREAEMWRNKEI